MISSSFFILFLFGTPGNLLHVHLSYRPQHHASLVGFIIWLQPRLTGSESATTAPPPTCGMHSPNEPNRSDHPAGSNHSGHSAAVHFANSPSEPNPSTSLSSSFPSPFRSTMGQRARDWNGYYGTQCNHPGSTDSPSAARRRAGSLCAVSSAARSCSRRPR